MLRLLIVDDSTGVNVASIEKCLADQGVDCDIRQAFTATEGQEILLSWAKSGQRAGIVTWDQTAHAGAGYDSGVNDPGILEFSETLMMLEAYFGKDFLPQDIFFHSTEPHSVQYDKIDWPWQEAPSLQWAEIKALGHENGIGFFTPTNKKPRTNDLLRLLNTRWGTNYALTPEEANRRTNALNLDEAVTGLKAGGIAPIEVTSRLQVETAHQLLPTAKVILPENPVPSLSFTGGTIGAHAGRIIFSPKDAESLSPGQSKILFLERAQELVLPPSGIEGLIVLVNDESAMHLEEGCARMGVPMAKGLAPGFIYERSEDGTAFKIWNATIENSPVHELRRFQEMTLEVAPANKAVQSQLYYGALPIENHRDALMEGLVPAIQAGNRLRLAFHKMQTLKAPITVGVNAATAQETRKAIEIGADGLYLGRTEDQFFYHPEVLRNRLMKPTSRSARRAFYVAQKAELSAILNEGKEAGRPFPITFRYLDAPPHEVVEPSGIAAFTRMVGGPQNLRGVQADLRINGLLKDQTRALVDAISETGYSEPVGLLVPNVQTRQEMFEVTAIYNSIAKGSNLLAPAPMLETLNAVNFDAAYLADLPMRCFGTNDLQSDLMGGVRRDQTEEIEKWQKIHGGGKNPFLSFSGQMERLLTSTMDKINDHRLLSQGKGSATARICGRQVRDGFNSISFAFYAGISISAPPDYLPYALSAVNRLAYEEAQQILGSRRITGDGYILRAQAA